MTQLLLLDRFVDRLRAEYPHFPLSVRPYQSPDDPTIELFIDILLVPEAQLHEVGMRAWELANEVYGDAHAPFLMTSVCPESSVEYFAKELEEAGVRLREVPTGGHVATPTASPLFTAPEPISVTVSVEALVWVPGGGVQWIEPSQELLLAWHTQDLSQLLQGHPAPTLAPTQSSPASTVRSLESNYPLAA